MAESAAKQTRGNADDIKAKRVTLADLSARGSAFYANKKYDEASDFLSRASLLQIELNGEIHPDNAEILFHYGRSLFKVGQSKSDVLGGPAAVVDAVGGSRAPSAAASGALDESASAVAAQIQQLASTNDAKHPEPEPGKDAAAGSDAGPSKPLFQFTGDENFDAEEEDAGPEDESQQEEDDDLGTAFEILDLARVCYLKKLQVLTLQHQGKEVAQEDSAAVRHVKERLADTHDCLAEISLENERYPSAICDGRDSLSYKMDLYPQDSEIIAEAHYKLSLAFEFASITLSNDDGTSTKRDVMDQSLRDEAIEEMELAIKSFKLRMQSKEVELTTMASSEDNDVARTAVAEMKEVIADMEQRLVDLRKDPIKADDQGGILGSALGQPPSAEAQARADEAVKHATDLTGIVRKKAKDAAPNDKRKADELLAAAAPAADGAALESPKKPKLAERDAGDKARGEPRQE